ncbi:hypothetical protein THAOC_17757, partial [Thalassiosira oceanica]
MKSWRGVTTVLLALARESWGSTGATALNKKSPVHQTPLPIAGTDTASLHTAGFLPIMVSAAPAFVNDLEGDGYDAFHAAAPAVIAYTQLLRDGSTRRLTRLSSTGLNAALRSGRPPALRRGRPIEFWRYCLPSPQLLVSRMWRGAMPTLGVDASVSGFLRGSGQIGTSSLDRVYTTLPKRARCSSTAAKPSWR